MDSTHVYFCSKTYNDWHTQGYWTLTNVPDLSSDVLLNTKWTFTVPQDTMKAKTADVVPDLRTRLKSLTSALQVSTLEN